ncbi:hypothetical protein R6Q57_016473 [Mikania cordata]
MIFDAFVAQQIKGRKEGLNYDSDIYELNAGNHIINITPNTVNGVLGIALERLLVNEKNKPRVGSSNSLIVWKDQYPNKSRITVKDVFDQIKRTENGDWLFKLSSSIQNCSRMDNKNHNSQPKVSEFYNQRP